MSKYFPDLFGKGDEFWDFDNMVNEYEWEQKRRAKKKASNTADFSDGAKSLSLAEYDVVDFQITNRGLDEFDVYNFDLTAVNRGKNTITELYFQEFFYDKNDRFIKFSFYVCDQVIKPGASVKCELFFNKEPEYSAPETCRIQWYEYTLERPDPFGNNVYRIDRDHAEVLRYHN